MIWRPSLKKYLTDYVMLFTMAGVLVLLDQLTKQWVRTNLGFSEVYLPGFWLTQYVRLIHWRNTGAAFGVFQNMNTVFTILSFVVSGAILYYFPRVPRQEWPLRLAMGLQLGGAVGNLIDRLTQGYVTDFISLGNFAVFNVADASISVGVVILILGMWLKDQREKPHQSSTAPAGDPPAQDMIAATPPEEVKGE
jgi:signal peptidase II